ncbi:hypothetical protein GCM10009868_41120 [Terrabacter aerolatus]|uniref:Blue (type 1) copper domain-containing protein n=1 Tax=Terrabacter aerolatus TaxID=422442 RepID=A0A512D622_9MICO|nr:hypothetical protein TAE01_37360 [Terrabacter aerolatus]
MRRLVSTLAALTLAAAVPVAAAGSASAHDSGHDRDHGHVTSVWVTGDGSHVKLSRWRVEEGPVLFHESTTNASPGGSQISLFRLLGKATVNTFKADLADEFSPNPKTAAKGTRELNRDVRATGLADVQKGYPASVRVNLHPGTYYLMDLGSFFGPMGPSGAPNPALTKLVVRDSDDDGWSWSDSSAREDGSGWHPTIWLTAADRFVGPGRLPAEGSVTFRNVGDSIHVAQFSPVKKGTTDKQIQAYYDSGVMAPPPFALNGPTFGLDVLSAGSSATLSYDMPPGTYVLQCFVADSVTGMPHAIMGMHKVVVLK